MGYQRETWHSGLTYSQICENCNSKIQYMDDKLDFRPWYADGFIYCPTCNKPLRHSEDYAINKPEEPVVVDITPGALPSISAFCTGCGRPFGEGDQFCSACGKRR